MTQRFIVSVRPLISFFKMLYAILLLFVPCIVCLALLLLLFLRSTNSMNLFLSYSHSYSYSFSNFCSPFVSPSFMFLIFFICSLQRERDFISGQPDDGFYQFLNEIMSVCMRESVCTITI